MLRRGMDVKFLCIHCGQKCKIDQSVIGYQIECPGCHQQITVPAPPMPPLASEVNVPPRTSALQLKLRAPSDTISHFKLHAGKTETPLRAKPRPPILPPTAENHPPSPQKEKIFQCINENCGEIWKQSQLIEQPIGGKIAYFCPRCQLGVKECEINRSFWKELPDAFAYPFRSPGGWILGTGTILLGFLHLGMRMGGLLVFILSLIFTVGYFGMLFQHIIRNTFFREEEPISWPELHGFGDLVDVFKKIGLSTFLVFSPAILCLFMVGHSLFTGEADSLASTGFWGLAALISLFGGLGYYPMAMLAVAMYDSFLAVNPIIVIPAIFRAIGPYCIVLITLAVTFFDWNPNTTSLVSRILLYLPYEFLRLYNLVFTARLLGLLCLTNAGRLGWFKERTKARHPFPPSNPIAGNFR